MVDLTPEFRKRAERIWRPLGEESFEVLGKWTNEDLQTVIEFFELSRAVNERHVERVRKLR